MLKPSEFDAIKLRRRIEETESQIRYALVNLEEALDYIKKMKEQLKPTDE